MNPKQDKEIKYCPHARPEGAMCASCLGVNSIQEEKKCCKLCYEIGAMTDDPYCLYDGDCKCHIPAPKEENCDCWRTSESCEKCPSEEVPNWEEEVKTWIAKEMPNKSLIRFIPLFKIIERLISQTKKAEHKRIIKNVGMLRQLLNEERIIAPNKMIDNNYILKALDIIK